jgi:hypothetical protein
MRNYRGAMPGKQSDRPKRKQYPTCKYQDCGRFPWPRKWRYKTGPKPPLKDEANGECGRKDERWRYAGRGLMEPIDLHAS